jgi:hypothetical protein
MEARPVGSVLGIFTADPPVELLQELRDSLFGQTGYRQNIHAIEAPKLAQEPGGGLLVHLDGYDHPRFVQ